MNVTIRLLQLIVKGGKNKTYSNVDGVLVDGLDSQATGDGATRDLWADAHHSG